MAIGCHRSPGAQITLNGERRGAEPGAGLVRQPGRDAAGHHRDSERWDMLVRRNTVAGAYRDARQRVVLGDDCGGCGAQRGSDRKDREIGKATLMVSCCHHAISLTIGSGKSGFWSTGNPAIIPGQKSRSGKLLQGRFPPIPGDELYGSWT